jgi:AraC-like DNA-binding protein
VKGRTDIPAERPAAQGALRIVQPAAHLRCFISAYFSSEISSDEPISDLSVPEWGALRFVIEGSIDVFRQGAEPFQATGAYVQGPSSRALEFQIRRSRIFGVGLLPEGFARFWQYDLRAIADDWMPIESFPDGALMGLRDDLMAQPDASAQFGIADSFFSNLLARRPANPLWKEVALVHQALNDPSVARIEDLAARTGMSASRLMRFCKARFGFTPKLLLRRQRFLRMLEALHRLPYAQWNSFVDPQYTDQSHMIREFRSFLGLSPGQYLARARVIQQASALARSAALGSALQGLD